MKYCITIMLFLFPAIFYAQQTVDILQQVYQVKKGDTAYSIARAHGVSLEELYQANPDIREGKVKKGGLLLIPKKQPVSVKQQVPVVEQAMPQQKAVHTSYDELRVAVLLPFEEKSDRAGKFLEFYQGFLMAVDSLSNQGTGITVYALNTGPKAEDIKQVLEEPELQSMQLIVGPADQSQVPALADFCQQHDIRLVLPFAHLTAPPGSHSTVYTVTPRNTTIQQHFSTILANKFSNKNYVVLNTDESDEKGQNFIDLLRTDLGNKGIAMRQMHILGDDAAYMAAFNEFRENCIVPDNVSIKTLNIFLARMKTFAEEHPQYKFSLIGYPEWQTYTSSLLKEFYQFDTYVYSSYYRNPLLGRTSDFERSFIHHFGYEMAPTFPRYGMLGFDLGYYFMYGMAKLGDNFDQKQQQLKFQPFQHHFVFTKDLEKQGFVNEATLVIHYSPEQTINVFQ